MSVVSGKTGRFAQDNICTNRFFSIMAKSAKQKKEMSELKKRFIEYYLKLPIQRLAAGSIGKDEDTVIRWKKNDKKFADQVASAKSAFVLEKVGKVRSMEWLLERIMSEYFMERKEIDSNVNIKLEATLDRMSKLLPD